MLAYLSAENAFLRTLGNRSLVLLFLCALTRTGQAAGSGAFLGISIALSQGVIIVGGPILAILFLLSTRLESDNLEIARFEILDEIREKGQKRKNSVLPYILFAFPTIAAGFLVVQFGIDLVPAAEPCPGFDHARFLYDFSLQSKLCVHDVTDNMPWIYPPLQLYFYLLLLVVCGWLSWSLGLQWGRQR
jgi:hypothetical protein